MAENLNINNLELDDNTFEVLPEGDYHFTVTDYEVGYYSGNSTKIPANTQQVTCELEIPTLDKTVRLKNNLFICKKLLFLVRTFAESIGMVGEKGKEKIDLTKMKGLTGICSITIRESNNGNEFNRVESFYPPSKAPAVTMNDEAWKKKDDFMDIGEDEMDELPYV